MRFALDEVLTTVDCGASELPTVQLDQSGAPFIAAR